MGYIAVSSYKGQQCVHGSPLFLAKTLQYLSLWKRSVKEIRSEKNISFNDKKQYEDMK